MKPFRLATLLALLATPAAAHVALESTTEAAGTYRVLRFTVGHGCAGKDTTGVTIHVPAVVVAPHPQPKPGWTLSVQQTASETAITWKGILPNDQFDEFAIHARMPDAPGALALPATQVCGAERVEWAEPVGSARPAPILTLLPAAADNSRRR